MLWMGIWVHPNANIPLEVGSAAAAVVALAWQRIGGGDAASAVAARQ